MSRFVQLEKNGQCFQVGHSQSVLFFSILNHPCFLQFEGYFALRKNDLKCCDIAPLICSSICGGYRASTRLFHSTRARALHSLSFQCNSSCRSSCLVDILQLFLGLPCFPFSCGFLQVNLLQNGLVNCGCEFSYEFRKCSVKSLRAGKYTKN